MLTFSTNTAIAVVVFWSEPRQGRLSEKALYIKIPNSYQKNAVISTFITCPNFITYFYFEYTYHFVQMINIATVGNYHCIVHQLASVIEPVTTRGLASQGSYGDRERRLWRRSTSSGHWGFQLVMRHSRCNTRRLNYKYIAYSYIIYIEIYGVSFKLLGLIKSLTLNSTTHAYLICLNTCMNTEIAYLDKMQCQNCPRA